MKVLTDIKTEMSETLKFNLTPNASSDLEVAEGQRLCQRIIILN